MVNPKPTTMTTSLPCPVCEAMVECVLTIGTVAPTRDGGRAAIGDIDAGPLYGHLEEEHPGTLSPDREGDIVPVVDRRETKPAGPEPDYPRRSIETKR